ncbi:2OG-Fe dioxygenase family protein [Nocardia beijingensis]|uniref:2OG-Fe dioxygenase family protein n=1 Tax=Nocardia beijingensis TaxID=95162 RepID=UPI001893E54C|nr:2OG-Fe dioxygenase family protein [Nocardia beijingensis]MBF6074265.1 2OG-Fe dioxygenase family protein [Nocardia beijingensis]
MAATRNSHHHSTTSEIGQDKGTPLHRLGYSRISAGSWLDIAEIQPLFDSVPNDGYVPEGFRYKSLSRVTVRDGLIRRGRHEPLFQTATYNPVHGDIEREYAPIAAPLFEALRDAICLFATGARLRENDEILVQAQRVTATAGFGGNQGLPAVEGFHQDAVGLVGILVVNRHHIDGGMTLLSREQNTEHAVFAAQLEPGDLLLIDDQRLFHYTTPIYSAEPDRIGFRDVVLFGWPSARLEYEGHS